jgi:hypothetical protein
MRNEILYDFISHYNPYTNITYFIKRGNNNWENYINGFEFEGYKMKGISFKELTEYITKNPKKKLKKITR